MRNLFLVLALVNLVVLAYVQWVIERPEPRPPYEGPGITLLREADRGALSEALLAARAGDPTSAASAVPELNTLDSVEIDITQFEANPIGTDGAPEQAGADPGQVASICTSIGPYLDAEAADIATATLIASGLEPSRRARASQVWQGYQVYIERTANEAAAGDITASLRASGIDAMPVISNSDSRALITIGVFPDLASAGAEADRVGDLGYEASIADSLTTAETFWLDVTLAEEDSLSLDLLQTPGEISRLEQLPCLGNAD